MALARAGSDTPLAGQTALITGATRGIGRAIARRLAREGVAVCVTGRSAERGRAVLDEIAAAGGRGIYKVLDVVDHAATEACVGETVAELGPLDIVVANAGVGTIGFVVDSDPAEWRRMMDVNFFGTANLIRAALPAMVERGKGTVIAIASSAATTGYEEWAGYCASKYAVAGFMECLGREMVGKGVRVCTVCPGSVDTPFWDDLNQDLHRAGTDSRAAMMSSDDVAEVVMLQLRLPSNVLVKNSLIFPTNEWH